jgi:hypothetical protein
LLGHQDTPRILPNRADCPQNPTAQTGHTQKIGRTDSKIHPETRPIVPHQKSGLAVRVRRLEEQVAGSMWQVANTKIGSGYLLPAACYLLLKSLAPSTLISHNHNHTDCNNLDSKGNP